MLGLSRWKHRHLLAAWVTYWVALVAVKLGGAISAVAQVSGPNGHGSASAGFGDKGLTFTVVNGATTIWSGASSLGAAALWVAGPPLLLWVAWMLKRPRPDAPHAARASTSWNDAPPVRPIRAPEPSFSDARRNDEVHASRPRDEKNG